MQHVFFLLISFFLLLAVSQETQHFFVDFFSLLSGWVFLCFWSYCGQLLFGIFFFFFDFGVEFFEYSFLFFVIHFLFILSLLLSLIVLCLTFKFVINHALLAYLCSGLTGYWIILILLLRIFCLFIIIYIHQKKKLNLSSLFSQ